MNKTEFLEKMKLIKKEYETHLPEKIDGILLIWQNLKNNQWNREIMLDCHKSIHKLTGSSGIMGFTQRSEICGIIEDDLQEILETNEPVNSSQFEKLDAYMKELQIQLHSISE